MAGFHDVRFPEDISYGSSGGPMFSTTVMALNSGFERRNINWSTVRAAYEVAHAIKEREQMEQLIAFFYARMGRAYSFRFKDWADFETGTQILGDGDGVETQFQIVKQYISGGFGYTRSITKPLTGTLVNVALDGVEQEEGTDYTVGWNTGIIHFDDPVPNGVEVTIGNVEFDVHCRFDTDQIAITHDFWETMSWPSIPIVEVKELA